MASQQGVRGLLSHAIWEDYEVQWNQKLGCGISGPVRPCKNKKTGDRFALKCLVDRPRARQEVVLHMRCSGHPHVVTIFDVYANEVQFPGEPKPKSRLLVVMELMDGGELFDRISRQKYFTEFQAARYTKQIALATQRCHSLNIAHRDLKPENLLLRDNLEDAAIKLSDFGFAKVDDGSLTTPHFTPYYVAPQVLEAQKQQARDKYCIVPVGSPYTYDKSCDMWSLGVVVYIMLCGYPPFYSETPTKQITKVMKRKIMAGQYNFPDEDWAHVSPLAKDLVTGLLRVDPEERLQVDQLLAHSWLHEAPYTQLQSPAVLLDQSALYETKQAHSYQLTQLRLPDNQLVLKPMGLAAVSNPILKKRNASVSEVASTNGVSSATSCRDDEPPCKQSAAGLTIQKLRDIIAHCVLPPTDVAEKFDARLFSLIQCACPHLVEDKAFQETLQSWKWDGQKFQDKVDHQDFASQISAIVQHMTPASPD